MIIVCGLSQAPRQFELHGASHVIGILGPETAHPVFAGLAPERHLKLSFNDINAPTQGMVHATSQDVERLIGFVRRWDRKAPLLVHCWAGISRSTATAFAVMCLLRGNEDEQALAHELRAASPSATPNRLITQMVDDALGRKGRMINAIENMGRGKDAFEGTPFILKIQM